MKRCGNMIKLHMGRVKDSVRRMREMSVMQVIKEFSGFCMQIITAGYLVFIALLLPFYYDPERGYGNIGTSKSIFFRAWGFRFARCMLVFFLIRLFASLFCLNRDKQQKGVKKEKGFRQRLFKIGKYFSLTDGFAAGYMLVLCLSYLLSDYREAAFLGATGWYMGFLPHLVLAGSYFAVSRMLNPKIRKILLCGLLTVSFVVFLAGLLNRYQIFSPKIKYVGPEFISTIGNINWYCGYWSAVFPVGCGCFLFCKGARDEKKIRGIAKSALLAIWCGVGFATGITQGSASGLIALAAMILIMGVIAVRGKDAKQRFTRYLKLLLIFCLMMLAMFITERVFPKNNYWTNHYYLITRTPFAWIATVVTALCLALYVLIGRKHEKCIMVIRETGRVGMIVTGVSLVLFAALIIGNTREPGSIGKLSQKGIFTFDDDWGSSRGATWSAGVRVWISQDVKHRLFGVGPDAMSEYIYSGENKKLLDNVEEVFGEMRLTNAHGEWITLLADTGVFGVLCFAGMMISAAWRFLGQTDSGDEKKRGAFGVLVACGLAVVSYTANNVFSFEQTMNVTQIFILLGVGENVMRQIKLPENNK